MDPFFTRSTIPAERLGNLLTCRELQQMATARMLYLLGVAFDSASRFTDVGVHAKITGIGPVLLANAGRALDAEYRLSDGSTVAVIDARAISPALRLSIRRCTLHTLIAITTYDSTGNIAVRQYAVLSLNADGSWQTVGNCSEEGGILAVADATPEMNYVPCMEEVIRMIAR